MNINQNEEIKYCNHCGSANKKSAVVCVECEKNIRTKYRPFYDFLKKHTKDDIKDNIADSVFSFIKNFLFSHLYGVSLSVLIVASSVSTVYAMNPYIEKVSEPVVAQEETSDNVVNEENEETPQVEAAPVDEDTLYDFYHLAGNYDAFVDLLRESNPYWGADGNLYASADEMYAENNIPGFEYRGVHEMISNPIPMYNVYDDPALADMTFASSNSDRYLDESSAVQGEACVTDIAKDLHSAGYNVAECNYVLSEVGDDYVKKLVYRFVYVEYEGKWYIVEDRLIDRVNA